MIARKLSTSLKNKKYISKKCLESENINGSVF